MMIIKRWNFGLGTLFSLIVIYFIYLYSKDKGWTVLAFAAKWYLIIVGGLILLSLGILVLFILLSLLMFFLAMLKLKPKRHKEAKRYIDAEYKVKE